MTARLTHVLWASRNPVADMPPEALARVRSEVPTARPVPVARPAWERLAFEAFWALDTERPRGWGIYPIPVSRIREWCRAEAPSPATARILEQVVRAMDRRYLEIEIARAEAEKPRAPGR